MGKQGNLRNTYADGSDSRRFPCVSDSVEGFVSFTRGGSLPSSLRRQNYQPSDMCMQDTLSSAYRGDSVFLARQRAGRPIALVSEFSLEVRAIHIKGNGRNLRRN